MEPAKASPSFLSGFLNLLRHCRLIKLDSFWESLIWTFRSAYWGFPLFSRAGSWNVPDPSDVKGTGIHYIQIIKSWNFLRPFFASRGYTLYQGMPSHMLETCPAPFPKAATQQEYPYSRRIYKDDQDGLFDVNSMRVWGARDSLGRDVVMKLVSDATVVSDELKVLRYLNTEKARSDPRNHTIPIIEYLTFDGLVFAVMPRWDGAFHPDFGTVIELMKCMEAFLEAFDFLHENHIFHGDFLDQNAGMNVCQHTQQFDLLGLREPSVTRYALYDFGNSSLYPHDVTIEEIRETKFFNFDYRRLPSPKEPYNPFPVDVISLGFVLQVHVRHIENIIPELGPFFDRMVDDIPENRPTARQALEDFRSIYSDLTPSQLAQEVTTYFWIDGVVTTKAQCVWPQKSQP
ncbi:hypothetical protein GALMADRAFT_132495 [Galerina marginata CBS 339.88]|uniref:Protein kinase domain-containing protein n=1 Tax=Galerina marginata (strain CBS 339.88) TaxID=685588 RepID=A0A067TU36_GALM3|nr:hypothetical protein GALMADRAFT_132495 [Galerina marginata CBS 339.88]